MNYKVNPNYVQKYIRDNIFTKEDARFKDVTNLRRWYYEGTVTFTRYYWSMAMAISSIDQVIADVIKPIVKDFHFNMWHLRYCVEYHKDGYPHVHFQVLASSPICPQTQHNIHARLCRRYGKSHWWQTGEEDKFHENDHFAGLWSEYLIKDREENNKENNMEHYYEYQFGF